MDFQEENNFYGYSDDENDCENNIPSGTQRGRRNIRDIKEAGELKIETQIANRNEKERIKRLEAIQKKFQGLILTEDDSQLILDYDFERNIPLVCVHKALVEKLKSHQKAGVQFMWSACYESLEQIKKSDGSGCIIAHCMGLGKTFQVVALVHTLLSNKLVGTRTVLICCPKNTLLNWINEFQMWITPDLGSINIYNPTKFENYASRLNEIATWQTNGGVCVINYELLRILLEDDSKAPKQYSLNERKNIYKNLCNPGPDLVICDEGHVLKNEETKLSKIMSRLRTMRRIVLTGTPMQNNLKEYYCMVQFVKPNLLGTRHEFTNMFVNPILNGQYENSLLEDVQLMKQRSHILHKKLLGCVQRFDLTTLKTFLPEKQEYVVSIALTKSQIDMYKFYLDNYSAKGDWKNQSVALFGDYQSLQRIWTHPYTLKLYGDKHKEENKNKKNKKRKKKKRNESDENEESSDSGDFHWRFPLSWWVQFASYDDTQNATISGKLVILLKILKECEENNEKLLVFSGSLYSLRMIEYFLNKINYSEFETPSLCNMTSTWELEQDYLVLTGQTSSEDRHKYCKSFNNKHDTRLRLFLISTKAGGMGINLTAANRAVLFDVSWNPSHDIQSIFRIYRIGQTKPCFVYRFVASGTMEEKIYERQVAKQSISFRVIDEKQIARHYTEKELLELYQFDPHKKSNTDISNLKDPLLRKILNEEPNIISGIHEHDSLLEHKEEEELLEMEKKNAWTLYNRNDNLDGLPEEEKTMLKYLTPETFDEKFLLQVLERKYKNLSSKEISDMMKELMPKIQNILEQPDFKEIMRREAFLHHSKRMRRLNFEKQIHMRNSHENTHLYTPHTEIGQDTEEKLEKTITIDSSIENINPETNATKKIIYSSDSDDSAFRFEIFKNVRRRSRGLKSARKPLRSWGMRNGKPFGFPDRDSD